jgi:hypothetical protein
MACNSLLPLPRACGEGIIGGLERFWIIAFKDLEKLAGTDEVFSASTSGIVNQIGVVSGKTFVEVGLVKSSSGVSQELTKDNMGISFFTQTLTLVLSDLTIANQEFVENVVNQPVAIIYKTRNDKYFVVGLNGQFEVSAIQGGTGVAETDMTGFNITMAGISRKPAPFLDTTILDSLIS